MLIAKSRSEPGRAFWVTGSVRGGMVGPRGGSGGRWATGGAVVAVGYVGLWAQAASVSAAPAMSVNRRALPVLRIVTMESVSFESRADGAVQDSYVKRCGASLVQQGRPGRI